MKKIENNLQAQIDHYLTWCREEKGRTEQTLRGRAWCLNNFAEFVRVNEVDTLRKLTENDVNSWLAEMEARGCSGRTINGRWHNVRPMIQYFRDMGMRIPTKTVLVKNYHAVKPRQVFYSEETINEVLEFANPMQWLLIKMTFDAGLRITELTNLRLSEIDGRALYYIGKGRKERESRISPETRARLDEYISYNKIKDYLWVNPHAKNAPYSSAYLREQMRKPFLYAGFDNFYPHALRHSFATAIVKNGADMMAARDMLGHTNVETTQRYVHNLEGHIGKMFDKFKFHICEEDENFGIAERREKVSVSRNHDPEFTNQLLKRLFGEEVMRK